MKTPKKMLKRWFFLVILGALFSVVAGQTVNAAVSTGQFVVVQRGPKPEEEVQLPSGKLPEKETIITQQKQPTQANQANKNKNDKAKRPKLSKQAAGGILPQTGEAMGLLALILGCILAGVILASWRRQRRLDAHENEQTK